MKNIAILMGMLFLILSPNLNGQVNKAITKLIDAGLVRPIDSLKTVSAQKVSAIKKNRLATPAKLEKVRNAYDSLALACNDYLYGIKADLMNKRERRGIFTYPDGYIAKLNIKLELIRKNQAAKLKQRIMDIDSRAGFPSLLLILTLTEEVIKTIKEIKQFIRDLNEAAIDTFLIKPNLFKTWEEL